MGASVGCFVTPTASEPPPPSSPLSHMCPNRIRALPGRTRGSGRRGPATPNRPKSERRHARRNAGFGGGAVRLRGDAGAGERLDGRMSVESRRAHGAPPSNLSNPKVNAVCASTMEMAALSIRASSSAKRPFTRASRIRRRFFYKTVA